MVYVTNFSHLSTPKIDTLSLRVYMYTSSVRQDVNSVNNQSFQIPIKMRTGAAASADELEP